MMMDDFAVAEETEAAFAAMTEGSGAEISLSEIEVADEEDFVDSATGVPSVVDEGVIAVDHNLSAVLYDRPPAGFVVSAATHR
jgi:hypothetical protein